MNEAERALGSAAEGLENAAEAQGKIFSEVQGVDQALGGVEADRHKMALAIEAAITRLQDTQNTATASEIDAKAAASLAEQLLTPTGGDEAVRRLRDNVSTFSWSAESVPGSLGELKAGLEELGIMLTAVKNKIDHLRHQTVPTVLERTKMLGDEGPNLSTSLREYL
jgi:hypothetical protein